ncbi:hypothetical protein QDT13_000693 [Acinetobacter baumannii]|uniref:hypothetical protein n=1 Tax=Acinetobacter baumannii TaxID=470 RepID=UPI00065F6589|nr:hypothetical protein [Acinetobacter baumannii]HBX4478756.1 hypothetical protein [Klebsiella pneumoniae]AKQ29909.1 hypothetical protein ACX61_05730 [Acinetobacter baumannii]EKV3804873.1 hypothetical protein [Acinetobacter baumannii]EKW1171330.1 hypothetical protein [Acinetobacter baumannii]KMV09467.1 hypothetical protein AB988_4297 [Acinetobacter baumannii]
MKPEQFIREFGEKKAREVVEGAPDGHKGYNDVINQYTRGVWFSRDVMLSDLKRLVESIDLVESWGGIEDLKLYDLSHCKNRPESAGYKLLKAIADYESIYGGGDE